jgi:hypothetical protein
MSVQESMPIRNNLFVNEPIRNNWPTIKFFWLELEHSLSFSLFSDRTRTIDRGSHIYMHWIDRLKNAAVCYY